MSVLAVGRRGARHRLPISGRLLALIVCLGALALAGAPVAYMLWPQGVPVARDAPALPVTVGGVTFNVPPAAIRVPMQRRPGFQSRVDLAFAWPSLSPPEPATHAPGVTPPVSERLFVKIVASDGTLPPVERLKAIYPRYTDGPETIGADGLVVRAFRNGTPYQGEELVYDPAAPDRFLLRCTRAVGATPGMCLAERRIAGADVTVRLPRDWLSDWRTVAERVERLLTQLRPLGG